MNKYLGLKFKRKTESPLPAYLVPFDIQDEKGEIYICRAFSSDERSEGKYYIFKYHLLNLYDLQGKLKKRIG